MEPKQIKKWSNGLIEKLPCKEKDYKTAIGQGMYVLTKASGGKTFRWNYRIRGKQKTMVLGTFGPSPNMSLAMAWAMLAKKKVLLQQGIDPMEEKKLAHLKTEGGETFEKIALEWYNSQLKNKVWKEATAKRIGNSLERRLIPIIGKMPIVEIEAAVLRPLFDKLRDEGFKHEHRKVKSICGQVFDYACMTSRTKYNPVLVFEKFFTIPKDTPRPAYTKPEDVAYLLRAIDSYTGRGPMVGCGLKLLALVFVRPGELCNAEWSEIDFETKRWHIPGEKMKMGRKHLVPLSRQSIEILNSIRSFSGDNKYVFPAQSRKGRHMNTHALNTALRSMGFSKNEVCAHGFRATAKTRLGESCKWNETSVDFQLAHAKKDPYTRHDEAKYLEERTEMMQWWADYLDELRTKYKA